MKNKFKFYSAKYSDEYLKQITLIPTISYLKGYELINTDEESPYHILCFSFWNWDFIIKYGVDLDK